MRLSSLILLILQMAMVLDIATATNLVVEADIDEIYILDTGYS